MATALLLWRRMSHNWTRRCNHTSYPWIQSKLYPIFTKLYPSIHAESSSSTPKSGKLASLASVLVFIFYLLTSFPRLLKQLYLLNKESEKLKLTAWLYFAIILACVQLTGPSDFFLRGRGRLYTGYCFYVFFLCLCVWLSSLLYFACACCVQNILE